MMKQLTIIFATIILFGTGLFAQTPPDAVNSNFKLKYPTATEVKCNKECADKWEFEFKMDSKCHSAEFDNSGQFILQETKICPKSLPKAIKKVILQDFTGYYLHGVELNQSEKGKVYEVEFVNCKQKLEVYFSKDGKVIKKEVEKIKHCNKKEMKCKKDMIHHKDGKCKKDKNHHKEHKCKTMKHHNCKK